MFLLNGKPLPLDTDFTDASGNSYPSNWIRLATESERSAIGITEVADEDNSFDNRFYWSKGNPKALEDKEESDEDGNPLYVKVLSIDADGKPVMVDGPDRLITKGLKSEFINQINKTAYSLLLDSDWMIIRKIERSIDLPVDIAFKRSEIVSEAARIIAEIKSCETVEGLIQALNTANWPK